MQTMRCNRGGRTRLPPASLAQLQGGKWKCKLANCTPTLPIRPRITIVNDDGFSL